MAHVSMSTARRESIKQILNNAQNKVGAEEIYKVSGMRIPKESAEVFYNKSTKLVKTLQEKYRSEIEKSK
jgi:hypothetical protein